MARFGAIDLANYSGTPMVSNVKRYFCVLTFIENDRVVAKVIPHKCRRKKLRGFAEHQQKRSRCSELGRHAETFVRGWTLPDYFRGRCNAF